MVDFNVYRPLGVLFRHFLRPYRLRFIVGIGLAILTGLLSGLHTLVFAPALQLFTGEQTPPASTFQDVTLSNIGPTVLQALGLDPGNPVQIVLMVSGAYFVTALVIALLQTATKVIILKMRVGLIHDLTSDLHGFLVRQPMQYFNERNVGDFLSRITTDVREAARGIDSSLSGILVAGFHILLTMLLLMRTDFLLTLGILSLGSLHFALSVFLGPRFVRAMSRNLAHGGGVNHLMMESFNGIRVVKTMAGERFMDRVVGDQLAKWRASFYDTALLRAIDQPLRLLVDALVISSALILTFLSMHYGRINIDAAAIYVALCLKLIPPVSQFTSGLFLMTGSAAGAARVLQILEADRVIEDGEEEPASFGHFLVLEGVTFAYKPGEPVLRDVHLEIRKGEKIALVGGSGAGKSTLTDLLLRLYDPQEGRILYDGTDIRRFRQRAYRRQFGVVNQDCLLFSGTIEDNIVYGRELDAGAYARAREVANCDFIDDFPDGDQTRVGDRGITLSGGQRQRIALARAVYSRPDFLILDEATSALDAESERQVQEGIRRAVENATAILVAHRLSTVREADRIVVMEQGQIQDIGRHEELLARNDTYRHLCSLQFLPEVSAHA